MNLESLKQAVKDLEKHYPYEDESGVIKISLGRYMNAMQLLRQVVNDEAAWRDCSALGVNQEETMSIQEVWEAAGGNPEIKASKQEVINALNMLDEVCEEADKKMQKADFVTVQRAWSKYIEFARPDFPDRWAIFHSGWRAAEHNIMNGESNGS